MTKVESCPSPDVLSGLDEGVLPEAMADAVRLHLNGCTICTALRRDLRLPEFAEPSDVELSNLEARVFGALPKQNNSARFWAVIGLAASLVLAATLWRYAPRNSETPAANTGAQSPLAPPAPPAAAVVFKLALEKPPLRLSLEDSVILRGKDLPPHEVYLKQLGEAMAPYREDRFAQAATQLEQLGQRYSAAPEPQFYRGAALLMAGDVRAAKEALLRAREIENDVLREDIAWYLSIAYERSGAWASALPLLNELCNGDGLHKADACSALAAQ